MYSHISLNLAAQLLLIAALVFLGLLTIAGFFGRLTWQLDITSHFRVQYLFSLVLVAVGCLVLGQIWFAVVAMVLAIVNAAVILPRFISLARAASNGSVCRLLLSNVLMHNRSYDQLRKLVAGEQPDLIVLIEPDRAWLANLDGLRADYPYWAVAARQDAYGVAVLSRQPFQSAEVIHLGPAEVPTVVARLNMLNHHDQMLTVIATHPPPPKGAVNSANRNNQLRALAQFVRQQGEALILCGDLNLSPWSPHFFDLLKSSGLADSGRGFGVQPTWPADNILLRTPIDHCLVSPHIAVRHRRLGPRIGSDHLPVILDFTLGLQEAPLRCLACHDRS
jgi:endonuclease/exonuclease/phosphatase (EEP) superfamily protein YafD